MQARYSHLVMIRKQWRKMKVYKKNFQLLCIILVWKIGLLTRIVIEQAKNMHDLASYVTNTLAIILSMCVLYILYVYVVSENSTKCVVCQKKVCYNT